MFIAVPQPPGAPFCLNTLLCLSVTTFDFQSAHFTLVPSPGELPGSVGQITTTTFFPDSLSISLSSSINGQPIILNGGGAFDPNSPYPPAFTDVEMCGAPPGVGGTCDDIRAGAIPGYVLTIYAAPATQTPTLGPTRTPTPFPTPSHHNCTTGFQCVTGNCVNGLCCVSPTCADNERCDVPGHGGVCWPWPPPVETPTPSAAEIVYRLTEGSNIVFVPLGPASPPATPVALTGTFRVIRSYPGAPNTLYQFSIINIDFEAAQLSVTNGPLPTGYGCPGAIAVGCMTATTLDLPPIVYFHADASVDGQQVALNGLGPGSGEGDPPVLTNLLVCGAPGDSTVGCNDIASGLRAGYKLTIFATPQG